MHVFIFGFNNCSVQLPELPKKSWGIIKFLKPSDSFEKSEVCSPLLKSFSFPIFKCEQFPWQFSMFSTISTDFLN